ncbi:EF-P lysine aminoacylase EpmA [Thermodesulfobacteriota bacterium]
MTVKKKGLFIRARVIHFIRQFFIDKDYLEIETPNLIPAPAPEVHIDAIKAGNSYLHTSPELYMKRLLCAGYPNIFQISKCYRDEERGNSHLPEFTLLEWYHTGIDYFRLMKECEELILFVAGELGFGETIKYLDKTIYLRRPWESISVSEAFKRYSGLSVNRALSSGSFDEIMVEEIEPKLPMDRPVFIYDYPASLAALARLKESDPQWAERFELYIGGLELANAFSELTDVPEQAERFTRENINRELLGKEKYPLPVKFLEELHLMPENAGIALGIDRLVMLFANASKIDDVVAFTPEEL